MVRTVVSLEMEDKLWLDRKAQEERVSLAELVRRAIRRYRQDDEPDARPLGQLLEATSGIWKGEDGLDYQVRMRQEWDDR